MISWPTQQHLQFVYEFSVHLSLGSEQKHRKKGQCQGLNICFVSSPACYVLFSRFLIHGWFNWIPISITYLYIHVCIHIYIYIQYRYMHVYLYRYIHVYTHIHIHGSVTFRSHFSSIPLCCGFIRKSRNRQRGWSNPGYSSSETLGSADVCHFH